MQVYHNITKGFVIHVRENKLTRIMSEKFTENTGRQVGVRELVSWQNSLTRVRDLIELASLYDLTIVLEYGCPYNQNRIDCMLFGQDSNENANVVLLELKQWTQVYAIPEQEGNFQEIYEVRTYTGGNLRIVPHPSQQVKGYHNHIKKHLGYFDSVFYLLNEQLAAKNLIWAKARKDRNKKEKSVIIVHGGPGTGKSLIAINVLAEAARRKYKAYYGCKSKPFVNGLQNLVGKNGKELFSNLYRFLPSRISEDELDLLLVDESHRIEKSSNFKYTKETDRTDMPQIEQLIRCARTAVFFIDDKQSVRSQEIGSSILIRQAAKKINANVWETTLEAQYRCMGSENYLLWLESVLGYSEGVSKLKKNEVFNFRIFDSPTRMYDQLKTHEKQTLNSARLVAGFCWPWSNPDSNGELIKDVVIGDFAMPWEAKEEYKLAEGIPKWYEWAYKSDGFNQVGCIYTAQGFEFDYIGVIIGNDLLYDPVTKKLKANIKATCDPTLKRYPANFETHVRNIYRVLLTRGMQGCTYILQIKRPKRILDRG